MQRQAGSSLARKTAGQSGQNGEKTAFAGRWRLRFSRTHVNRNRIKSQWRRKP